jgi:hypothetical protein
MLICESGHFAFAMCAGDIQCIVYDGRAARLRDDHSRLSSVILGRELL